jgi:hypothetical protein
MKKIFSSLFFISASFWGFGQNLNAENQFKVNMGFATPVGKFGDTNMKVTGSGIAKTGVFLTAGYSRFVNKNLGVGLDIIHVSNKMDEDAILTEAKKLDAAISSASTTSWKSFMSLLTLTYRYQLENSHFQPYLKASGGLAHATAPEITYENTYSGQSVRQAATATSTALGIGAGFQYRFNSLALGLEASYMYTKPEYKLLTVPFEQVMSTLNTSISVSYFWGKN